MEFFCPSLPTYFDVLARVSAHNFYLRRLFVHEISFCSGFGHYNYLAQVLNIRSSYIYLYIYRIYTHTNYYITVKMILEVEK